VYTLWRSPELKNCNTDYYEQKHYHSAIAAALHVGEAVQAFFLASLQYNLNPLVVLLWTLNVFFFGIFGFWPLAFPQVFQDNKATYCSLPGSLCFNTDLQ